MDQSYPDLSVAEAVTHPGAAYDQTVLVLQGGGALGSYQGGAYEVLHAGGIRPDWVAGVSIGAINAAIIAGNAPDDRVEKLRSFWVQITSESPADTLSGFNPWLKSAFRQWSGYMSALNGVPGFFAPPPLRRSSRRGPCLRKRASTTFRRCARPCCTMSISTA